MMNFPYKLKKAVFLSRPNRFLAHILIDGHEAKAHVADPGRLKELLIPGVTLWVDKAPDPDRKTAYTVRLVEKNGILVSIHSGLPNTWMEHSLKNRLLPELADYDLVRREYPLGKHRFDFLLSRNGIQTILEVKSVTLVNDGTALFPDAPTVRGASHVETLTRLQKEGKPAMVFFVIQRPDAVRFKPFAERDPRLASALKNAREAGVIIHARTCTLELHRISWNKHIPVIL